MGIVERFIESKEKEKEVIDFYKEAFCVDGKVRVMNKICNFKIKGVVELNDSKRGRFYIGCLEKQCYCGEG